LASVRMRSWLTAVLAFTAIMAITAGIALAQGPYPMQAPPAQTGPPPGAAPPGPAQQQQPLEYAFRPDLTNPEYGECLQLERNWRTLWQRYAQAYQTAMTLTPSHPQYQQQVAYVNGLKAQLDASWSAFSGKCVYFPPARR
jgi:hypothetical protein